MAKADKLTIEVVEWEGRIHCLYLNDTRFAGSKPWGGGRTIATFKVEPRDLVGAIQMLPDAQRKEILKALMEHEAQVTI